MSGPESLLNCLTDAALLDELHNLLWVDPFDNRGSPDLGWMCRDHALVVGHLAELHGLDVMLRHGKCMFVQGPTVDGAPPVGVGQDETAGGHTWVYVDRIGDIDVSPKLSLRFSRWRPLRSPGVIGARFVAEGDARFVLTGDLHEYEQAVAAASHLSDVAQAIYWLDREEPLSGEVRAKGLSWPDSRVSIRLRQRGQPDDLYSRAARHLLGVWRGERRSLRRVSFNKAWTYVAQDPELGEAQVRESTPRSPRRHTS